MSRWEYLVKDGEFDPHNYNIVIDGNLLYVTEEFRTVRDFLNAGYKLISSEEMSALEKEYNKSLCNDWIEIDAEKYDYAMNVLPPVKYSNGGFYVREPFIGTIHGFYQEWNGKFYTSLQDLFTPRMEILENLSSYITKSNAS